MSKKRTNYDRLDAALDGFFKLTTKVSPLGYTVETQSAKIDARYIRLYAKSQIIKPQDIKIDALRRRIKTLGAKELLLKQRLTKIEDILPLLYYHIVNSDSKVSGLLKDENNTILDLDYRLIRDCLAAAGI